MSRKGLNMLLSSAMMLVAFALLLKNGDKGTVPPHLSIGSFPLSVGNWSGVRMPLDDKAKKILNADGYASILFTRGPGEPPVFFFSAFYEHQTPEKNIHSPKNCLPSSGWAILWSKNLPLFLYGHGSTPVQVNMDIIQKGLDKQIVLYWYQERGRIFPSEYWGRYYLVKDALLLHRTDGALVRVSMPITGSEETALLTETRFLQKIAPLLSDYIPGRPGQRNRSLHNASWHPSVQGAPYGQ